MNLMPYKNIHIEFIQTIIDAGFASEGVKIVFRNSDTWNFELPEALKEHKSIVLDIKGQSLEDSYVTKDGIFISTAFGDDVYTKLFDFDDVIQVITFEGDVIYHKTLSFEPTKVTENTKTHQSINTKHLKMDEKGLAFSMDKLRSLNKHL